MISLRIIFLALVAGFIWWSLHGRWAEVRDGFSGVPWWGSVSAAVLFVVGLGITGLVWRSILAGFGYSLSVHDAFAVFFPGQLGKYVPGSVWSFGVQAHLAREHKVPVRFTITTSLVFLGFCLTSAGLLGGLVGLVVPDATDLPAWVLMVSVVISVAGSHRWFINTLATKVAGGRVALSWGHIGEATALSVLAWGAYLLGMVLLVPDAGLVGWAALAAGMVFSFITGVLVFLAPAGLGAREATMVAVASGAVGLGVATAVAVITRILFLVGDLVLAGGSWWWSRYTPRRLGALDHRDLFR